MSQTDVADGRWHHVAYTTDGEVGNFFVDGVREGSHATDYEFKKTSAGLWDRSLTMQDHLIT